VLGGSVTRPIRSLRDLNRSGEGSSDPSFNRLGQLRAVVSPNPRSLEFFLKCEDDILESILQTSISWNRISLVIFWLIAGFRCGFKEELLAMVSIRLDLAWKLCVRLQYDDVVSMTDIDAVEMEKCGHELETAWVEVLRGIRGAREPRREGRSCLTSICSGCGQSRELSTS
jgi:hypothetical protein